jgi:hypothetical protein
MKKSHIFILIIILITSCSLYVTPEPEEKEVDFPPSNFEIIIEKVTDTEIIIKWTDAIDTEDETVTYEVALFDSVVAFDLTNKYYYLKNLMPNTEYKIGVNAIDHSFNKKSVSQNIKTFESLLRDVFHIDFGFFFGYRIFNIIKTIDSGFLISGVKLERDGIQFVAKLNEEFEIEWVKEYGSSRMKEGTDLIQLSDNNYLIVRNESLFKIDMQGNQIWYYNNIHTTDVTTINSAYELDNGEIVITGTTNFNYNKNVRLEAFITKLSFNGNEVWHKYYGTHEENRSEKIIQKQNDNLVIFGTSSFQFQENGEIEDCFWLLETDNIGAILKDTIYGNKYLGSDVPKKVFALANNSLLLCGSLNAAMGNSGLYNFMPRFLWVNSSYEITQEFYPEITGLGEFPEFGGMVNINEQKFVFFSNLYGGVYIGESNISGEITRELKLLNFPEAMFMVKNKNDDFVYFTNSGNVFIVNPNGYFE